MSDQDPWDGLPNGAFVSWDNVGDEVVGDVIGKGMGQDFNGNPCPQLVIRTDDGAETTVTAGQAQLRAKLLEGKPQVGDRIRIVFTQSEKRDGGKTLKHFEVTIKSGGAKSPVTEEAVAAATDDF
jgi:hypothetical protein